MTSDAWRPALDRLVTLGRARGFVTVDEINTTLPQQEVFPGFIEHVLATLSEAGVNVTEGDEDGDDEEAFVESPRGPAPLQSGAEAPLEPEA
ncbi:RNA polymerase sigma factor region1.1 domain-containing protein [Sabulicella rubraurantiaca]|uniref:RNA polymerase sigma factor region1.1 domain-containing protein n=1 Tax=Sabulicella rubraurantiaca TaxID=2811429 RepID=UPI001A972AC7|nr:RNA polymerase sigma factor region1.1 domain-containing protein [Sabulicella rubraurantiaca]